MTTPSYKLFAIGNPLLDLQATNGEELLKKYDLKANDAILAEEKHAPMYAHRVRANYHFMLMNAPATMTW